MKKSLRITKLFSLIAFILLSVSSQVYAATLPGSLLVTVLVLPSCLSVIGAPITVSTTGTTAVSSSSTITVLCVVNTPFTVTLNGGSTAGGTIAQRKVTDGLGNTLNYNLYTDSAFTTIAGDGTTAGSAKYSGTAALLGNIFPIYMQVPAQTIPSTSLTYNDTVTLTLTY